MRPFVGIFLCFWACASLGEGGAAGINGPRRDKVAALPIGLLVLPMGRAVQSN